MTPEQIQQIQEQIRERFPLVKTFSSDGNSVSMRQRAADWVEFAITLREVLASDRGSLAACSCTRCLIERLAEALEIASQEAI